MPTTRPRHIITETEEIAAAIDSVPPAAAGESRADVLRRLVLIGAAQVRDQRRAHRARVVANAGVFDGLYPPDYLDDLRAEWPE